MKMKTLASFVLALVALVVGMPTASQGASGAIIRYHIVTAPNSPTNSSCLQNVMSYVDKKGRVGLIPTDVLANPAALNMPTVLRGSELNYSSMMEIWDSVANPTGAFSNQFGQRLAVTLDYWDDVPFLASDIWCRMWSSDAANTLRFASNMTTNGTTPLTFSPTLRGELWEENGTIVPYNNGQTIAGRPINRIMCMVRIGWVVSSPAELQLNLDYFRNQMSITNFASFYRLNGWGVTNSLSSRSHLTAKGVDGNGGQVFCLQGQRRMNMTYGLERATSLDKPIHWTIIAGRLTDGAGYTNTLPIAFYRSFEEGINPPLAGRATATFPLPVLEVSNGPE